MQSIAVINGRPCIWGDTVLALIRQSGLLETIHEEVVDGIGRCTVKRRREEPVTREFSLDDAKRAGLATKQGPWQQYPTRMLQLRARAFALRDVFPDVLRGMHVREEVEDSAEPLSSPAADAITAPTRTEVLRQRIALQRPPTPSITLDTVLALIEAGDLDEAAAQAVKLTSPEDKKAARRAYATARQASQQTAREGLKPTDKAMANEAPTRPMITPPALITEEQQQQLHGLISRLGLTAEDICQQQGVATLSEMTQPQAESAKADLLKIQAEEGQ